MEEESMTKKELSSGSSVKKNKQFHDRSKKARRQQEEEFAREKKGKPEQMQTSHKFQLRGLYSGFKSFLETESLLPS